MEKGNYFAYRYYLDKIKADPQMARYLEDRFQWRLGKYQEKGGIVNHFIREHSRSNGAFRGRNIERMEKPFL